MNKFAKIILGIGVVSVAAVAIAVGVGVAKYGPTKQISIYKEEKPKNDQKQIRQIPPATPSTGETQNTPTESNGGTTASQPSTTSSQPTNSN